MRFMNQQVTGLVKKAAFFFVFSLLLRLHGVEGGGAAAAEVSEVQIGRAHV